MKNNFLLNFSEKIKGKKNNFWFGLIGFFIIIFIFLFTLFIPPKNFPTGEIISVEKGKGLVAISNNLKDNNMLRSKRLFQSLVIIMGGEKRLKAGDYFFDKKENLLSLAKRMVKGQYGASYKRVTIPEGSTINEISEILNSNLELFNKQAFLEKALPLEGYLFPDTYFFFSSQDYEEIIDIMRKNFDNQTKELKEEAINLGKNFKDIVIMASIIEKEAFEKDEKRIISGILWKRMEIGMALQVDAPFMYLLGKKSNQLTLDDLALDSLYNTYLYRGLPPTAIGSFGLDSIKASIYPESSPYLFYLHDSQGEIHYARDHDQHVENKNRYLR